MFDLKRLPCFHRHTSSWCRQAGWWEKVWSLTAGQPGLQPLQAGEQGQRSRRQASSWWRQSHSECDWPHLTWRRARRTGAEAAWWSSQRLSEDKKRFTFHVCQKRKKERKKSPICIAFIMPYYLVFTLSRASESMEALASSASRFMASLSFSVLFHLENGTH